MNIILFFIGALLGFIGTYSIMKTRIDINNDFINFLKPNSNKYFKIMSIVYSDGLTIDKFNKIKELVDKDN